MIIALHIMSLQDPVYIIVAEAVCVVCVCEIIYDTCKNML